MRRTRKNKTAKTISVRKPGDVALSALATLQLDAASGPVGRWLVERRWRAWTLVGLVPAADLMFRK